MLLIFAIVAPIAAGILQMAISRSREYQADRTAAQLINDGEPLARALEKLHGYSQRIPSRCPRRRPATTSSTRWPVAGPTSPTVSTHPQAEDRIRRLRAREWAQ